MKLEEMTLEQLVIALEVNIQQASKIHKEHKDIENEICNRVKQIRESNHA